MCQTTVQISVCRAENKVDAKRRQRSGGPKRSTAAASSTRGQANGACGRTGRPAADNKTSPPCVDDGLDGLDAETDVCCIRGRGATPRCRGAARACGPLRPVLAPSATPDTLRTHFAHFVHSAFTSCDHKYSESSAVIHRGGSEQASSLSSRFDALEIAAGKTRRLRRQDCGRG